MCKLLIISWVANACGVSLRQDVVEYNDPHDAETAYQRVFAANKVRRGETLITLPTTEAVKLW